MPVKIELNKNAGDGFKPVKIYTRDIENEALTQLEKIAQLPIIHSHIAAMPDVHLGIGAIVGSVIPTLKAIIRAAVGIGIGIGCGMSAVRLSIKSSQLPDNLGAMRDVIERAVPVGLNAYKTVSIRASACKQLTAGIDWLFERHPAVMKMLKQPNTVWAKQMGTLGSGNHFIEVCVDENKDVWKCCIQADEGLAMPLDNILSP